MEEITIKGTADAVKTILENARLSGMTVSGYLIMLAVKDGKERFYRR